MPLNEGELAKEIINVKLDVIAIKTTVGHIQDALEKYDKQNQGISALAATVNTLAGRLSS